MSSLVVGLLAGWCVLRLSGVDRRWPWRVASLGRSTPMSTRRADPSPRPGRLADLLPTRRSGNRRVRTGGDARHEPGLDRNLGEVIDLLVLALTAGHSLRGAVAAVGEVADGPVGEAFREASAATQRGASLSDELAGLVDRLGPAARPLASTLVLSLTSGTPIGPALARLGDHERRRVRRRAEERVRRLPVTLLAPLVGLVLPAFVVLTIVPVALSTARSAADLALPPTPPSAHADTTIRSTP